MWSYIILVIIYYNVIHYKRFFFRFNRKYTEYTESNYDKISSFNFGFSEHCSLVYVNGLIDCLAAGELLMRLIGIGNLPNLLGFSLNLESIITPEISETFPNNCRLNNILMQH